MKFGMFICAAVMAAVKFGALAAAVGDECIVNGGFEQLTTAKCSGGYGGLDGDVYGFTLAWKGATMANNDGVYGAPSGLRAGTCYLALDGSTTARQVFHAPATGTYDLTFRYARRTGGGWEKEYQLTVLIDGVEIVPDGASSATIVYNDNVKHDYAATGIPLAQGDHTLALRGWCAGSDTACLIDDVSLKVASIESVSSSSQWLPARGELFHVDASQTNTMSLTSVNGTNFVNQWNDASSSSMYAKRRSSTSARGYLDTINGKPVVNFGSLVSTASTTDGIGGCLDWSSSRAEVKEIYMVVGRTSAPGNSNPQFVLGDTGSYDFHSGSYNSIFISSVEGKNIAGYYDIIEVNGREVPYNYELGGGINILHLRAKSTVHGGAFGADRTSRYGGIYYGEVIVYNRALTSEEQQGVYSYLYDKWSASDGAPQGRVSLIDYSATNAVFELAVDFAGSCGEKAAVKFSFRRDHKNRLAGFKDIEAEVTSGTAITNEIHGLVEGRRYRYACQFVNSKGVYAVTNIFIARKRLTRDVVATAPVFHVDAMAAESMTFVPAGGTNFVRRWYDCDVSSRYCYTDAAKPFVNTEYFHGYPVMDFGAGVNYGSSINTVNGKGAYMQWSTRRTDIRDVFLVYQDYPGGPQFLLGDESVYHFHRGGNRELFSSQYNTGFKSGYSIWVDDQKSLSAQYALPDGWHVIRLKPSQNVTANLFAGERISQSCRRLGGYRLAEAIIYNSALSDADADKVMKYLTDKWWFVDQPFGPTIFYVR